MKPLLLAVVLLYHSVSNAQTDIKLRDLKEHVGDSVKVQGKISGVSPNSRSSKRPTLIYVGEKYPKQALTVSISPQTRSKLHITPSTSDVGNIVWVCGKLEKYKGNMRIRITDPRQLDVVQDMQGEPK
jgi:hypothetical protein